MSNLNKWDFWYKDLEEIPSAFKYGDTVTYELGSNFLKDCNTIEDWGTGAGGFKRFIPTAIGVDGSDTRFAEKKFVDLANYTSKCEGIFMRHVLEHNVEWEKILTNALTSCTHKLCIVLFTPFSDSTIRIDGGLKTTVAVPDLSLGKNKFEEIINMFNPKSIRYETYNTDTVYKQEIVVYIEK
jgi:hypothetical protein